MTPLMLKLSIKNGTSAPIDGMTFQFKQNYFGLKTIKPNTGTIGIEEKSEVNIEIETNNSASINLKESLVYPYSIHTAFKCSADTYFFKVPIHMNHLLEIKGQLTKLDLKKSWNQTRHSKVYPPVSLPAIAKNSEAIANQLRENNMFVVQKKRDEEDQLMLYISCRVANQKLAFMCIELSSQKMGVEVRSEDPEILDLLYQGVLFALNQ